MRKLDLSPEDRKAHLKRLAAARNAKWWKNKSKEDKSKICRRASELRRKKRQEMGQEQLAALRKKENAAFRAGCIKRGFDNAEACRKRYAKNPEYFKSRANIYYKNNREKLREAGKRWAEKNREKLKVWARAYIKNRLLTDINFRIKSNLRSRLRLAVRSTGDRTLDFLGCSINHLRNHLQSQFKKGMSWDNYGAWHIDHKIPCAKFDLTDRSQALVCFHFSNLAPLWAVDNLKKGDKIIDGQQGLPLLYEK